MTTDIDRMIEEALQGEEQALFRETAREPGFFGQALGVFDGRAGWANVVLMVAQTAAFFFGAWAAWRFFQADTPLSALHWGLPASVLILGSLVMKMALVPVVQANRMMRELKRLELQIAVARKG
ncbi:hypothetical protein GCM10009116_21610 [Brevundimonas basaltis]|uniref:Putative integral membrane protein n=1 Tax=Brevundimonas basaltis TaxID=472166 RepID=A0A7W8HZM1_9CAUL|nr:DUF6768 family protein [Brevundimonas basaltis]MBB5291910.1 putative integral membrane protein [Brevundimonas basaltis]